MSPFRWIFNILLLVGGFGLLMLLFEGSGFFDRMIGKGRVEQDGGMQAQVSQSTRNYDEVVLKSDRNGHFWVEAYVENEPITFMVDTGATHVFLSEDDAERIGFDLWDEDYHGIAKTADGTARFAPVMIGEINIDDSIVVTRVRGAVIEGEGNISLLGMSFLNQLSGFEVNGDEMVLKP